MENRTDRSEKNCKITCDLFFERFLLVICTDSVDIAGRECNAHSFYQRAF